MLEGFIEKCQEIKEDMSPITEKCKGISDIWDKFENVPVLGEIVQGVGWVLDIPGKIISYGLEVTGL